MSLPQFTANSKLTENNDSKAIVRAFNSLVTNLQQIFTSLLGKVQLDSVLLTGIPLSMGPNTIPHTLGRTLTGWSVVRIDAPAFISDLQTMSADPQTYLVLVASAPCTVSLEVF